MEKSVKKFVMEMFDEADFRVFQDNKFLILIGANSEKEKDKIVGNKKAIYVGLNK